MTVLYRRWEEIWARKEEMTPKLYTAKVRHLDGSEQLHVAFATSEEEAKQEIMGVKTVPEGTVFVGFLPTRK